MLHPEQDSRPASEGGPLHELAREIEETQRRQSDTLTNIVHRLRALDPARAAASGAGYGDEPWDAASAEALMQTYEEDAASQADVAGSASPAAGTPDWLSPRLHDVTQQIKRTLSDLKPGRTAALVEERLDQFQRYMGAALEDVVRRADLDGLTRIEQHIGDIGEELQHLEQQVQRLEGVEADVRTVMEQVSDARLASLLDYDSRFAADLEAVATRAAEEVHVRLGQAGDEAAARRHEELCALIEASIQERRQAETEASSLVAGLRGHVSAQADRYDEIKALIEETRQEQRQSEQTALGMLDTLQQALVRLLDRMDVLEEQHRATPSTPEAQHPAPAYGAAAATAFAPPPVPAEPALPEERPGGGYAAEPDLAETPLAEVPAAFEPPGGEASLAEDEGADDSRIERLRRDLIADARRAKLKAAANRAEAIAEKAEPWRRGAETAKAVPAETARRAFSFGGGRLFGSSPKLLAGVLALVVAINGGLLLMNRKGSAVPPVPEINLPASAASEAGAGEAETESPEAAPERRSSLDGDGTDYAEFGAPGAAEGAAPRPGLSADQMFTPYGALDDVLNPPQVEAPGETAAAPQGTMIAKPMGSLPDAAVADLYTQQVLAGLSGQLGAIAAGKTPDALLPEQRGRIDNSFSTIETAAVPDDGAARAGSADLPPATVGPLSLRLAAAGGDASAEFEVAARLAEGKGTAQNFAEAARWYQRSAAKGFAQSQYRLGTLYERGLGVQQDIGRARVWYGRAAEQGNVKAMHNLAVLAAGGDSGEADYATALRWFTEAAEHGLADSQFNLGVLYENGLGVAADRVAAYKWYALAAKSGDADAAGLRDALEAKLSKPELDQAEQLVAQFKARPPIRLANDALAAGEDWKRRAAGDANI